MYPKIYGLKPEIHFKPSMSVPATWANPAWGRAGQWDAVSSSRPALGRALLWLFPYLVLKSSNPGIKLSSLIAWNWVFTADSSTYLEKRLFYMIRNPTEDNKTSGHLKTAFTVDCSQELEKLQRGSKLLLIIMVKQVQFLMLPTLHQQPGKGTKYSSLCISFLSFVFVLCMCICELCSKICLHLYLHESY